MRRKTKVFLVLFLVASLLMSSIAFAGDNKKTTGNEEKAKKQFDYFMSDDKADTKGKKELKFAYDENELLFVHQPCEGDVYYKGETIKAMFHSYDTWVDYRTAAWSFFYSVDSNGNVKKHYYTVEYDDLVPVDGYMEYKCSIKTKSFPVGNYAFGAMNAAWDEETGEDVFPSNSPIVAVGVKIKQLKAPTSLKIKVGKKKAKITFKKATGATKYEVYRSTKKTKGFKKIATIKKTSYLDKKVKRKKKYYYKVKTIRSAGHGTIKSGFSSVKRSKKVK